MVGRFLWKTAVAVCAAGWYLCGCDLFAVRDFEPRPEVLAPAQDAFAVGATRTYLWTEGMGAAPNDSVSVSRQITVTHTGDSTRGGEELPRLVFATDDGAPAPAGILSTLGFNASQSIWDTASLADPGADADLPASPQIGWRRDTAVGDLSFVNQLQGIDTLSRSEGLVETWKFAESTYYAGHAVAVTYSWFGRSGLVQAVGQWTQFPAGGQPARWWRKVTAP